MSTDPTMNSLFKNKKILITGGTGSLGQALTKRLLSLGVDTIRIFSRNEYNQIEMEKKFNDKKLRFLLGDIRDGERLTKAMADIDIVFHAAALKHVPKIEYNPFEAIKTNVIGSQNVIDSSVASNVEKVVCIGTDKSVLPLNTYGATKLLMEKIFVSANNYINPEKYRTKFVAVRYGNVLGSSGSVIPLMVEQIKQGKKITMTDPKMTRFSITMDDALTFILNATKYGKGSEIFIPKMKAYVIDDVINALKEIFSYDDIEEVGARPGEKLEENLINSDEIKFAWEYQNLLMIINPFYSLFRDDAIKESYKGIKKFEGYDSYSSGHVEKLTVNEIKKLIQNYENL